MKATPYVISETNLSHAWGRVLWHVAKSPGPNLKPLLVSISGFGADGSPQEDDAIRVALDDFLAKNKKWSVEIVAFTIFPRRYTWLAAVIGRNSIKFAWTRCRTSRQKIQA